VKRRPCSQTGNVDCVQDDAAKGAEALELGLGHAVVGYWGGPEK
jgi:hypothetical protein